MNKKVILSGIILTHMFQSSTTTPPHTHHEKMGQETKKEKAGSTFGLLYGLAATPLGSLLYAYHTNPDFKEKVHEKKDATKDFIIRRCLVPAHLKIEKIKDEGPSIKDFFLGCVVISAAYGLKKLCGFLELWHAVRKQDLGPTKKAFSKVYAFFKKHKQAAGILGFSGLSALGSYALWNTISGIPPISLIDQFLLSLTAQQRIQIQRSSELQELLDQAKHDPTLMQMSEPFMMLLSEKQRRLVDQLVVEYSKNNPHLAFLD